eukprot:5752966-Prymnesium_polylepis.1
MQRWCRGPRSGTSQSSAAGGRRRASFVSGELYCGDEREKSVPRQPVSRVYSAKARGIGVHNTASEACFTGGRLRTARCTG